MTLKMYVNTMEFSVLSNRINYFFWVKNLVDKGLSRGCRRFGFISVQHIFSVLHIA